MVRFLVLACCVLVASAYAYPSSTAGEDEGAVDKVYRFVKECGDKDMSVCMKMRALTFMDSIIQSGDIAVTDGVVLRQTGVVNKGRALQQPEDDTQVEGLLVDRVAKFLQTHTLQFKVPEESIEDMKRSIDEGRKKKKKLLLPLLLAIKLKAAALIPLIIGGLALLAFKALIVSKIALVLSGIIALKKLLGGQGHSTSYEVVSHPAHHDEHHYGRALAQDLAYSAHTPQ